MPLRLSRAAARGDRCPRYRGLIGRFLGRESGPISQNKGSLSNNRRKHEFQALRDDEVALIEGIVRDAFEGFEGKPATSPA
jgi:hypothetical protein